MAAMDARQEKKRRLQACLKEIKQLVAARFPSQPVGSVDALQRVAAALRRSHVQLADELRLAHLPGTSAAPADADRRPQGADRSNCPTEPHESDASWLSVTVNRADATVVHCDHCDQLSLSVGDCLQRRFDRAAWAAFEPLLQHRSSADQCDNIQLTCRFRRDENCADYDGALEVRLCGGAALNDGQQVALQVRPVASLYVGAAASLQLGTAFASAHASSLRCVALSPAGTTALGYVPAELAELTPFDLVHRRDAAVLGTCLLEARCRAGTKPPTSKCQWLARARNGAFVLLASEWCVHTNPWTGAVDYVVAKHTVMDVPRAAAAVNNNSQQPDDAPTAFDLDVLRTPADDGTGADSSTDEERRRVAGQVIAAFARSSLTLNASDEPTHNSASVTTHHVSRLNESARTAQHQHQQQQQHQHQQASAHTPPMLASMPLMHLTPALSAAAAAAMAAAAGHNGGQAAAGTVHTTLGAYVDGLVEAMVADANRNGPPVSLAQLEQAVQLHGWASTSAPVQPHQQLHHNPSTADRANHCSPESTSSSGHLSYTQINCLENVQRLLTSQPRTAAVDGRFSPQPPVAAEPETQSDAGASTGAAATTGSTGCAAQQRATGHRSHSASEAPAPVPLTRDALRRHTRNMEKEYKETYKRRLSSTSSGALASHLRKASAPNLVMVASASDAQPLALKRTRTTVDALAPPTPTTGSVAAATHSVGENVVSASNPLRLDMHMAAAITSYPADCMHAAVSSSCHNPTGGLLHSWTISRPNVQISSMPLPYASAAPSATCNSGQPLSLVTRGSMPAPGPSHRRSADRAGASSAVSQVPGAGAFCAPHATMPPPASVAAQQQQPCRLTLAQTTGQHGGAHGQQSNVLSNVSTEGSQIKEVADALMLLQDT